ncbi:hypothetical protein HPC37_02745 [Pasteurellaceae bacterium 20609_3]|uniref:organomercurial lyase n=1 Tax=Spirabiliibacterium mucosae TaxID=28156 RepID=UPI001AAC6D66|nr:organomercurial lyase [Spirabiliibacterium mucosae]MBE2897773.1 hypothetical protein [Spirabiliibacterium mucosae]
MSNHYPITKLISQPIVSKLTAEQAALRNEILQRLLAGKALDFTPHQQAIVAELAGKNALALDGNTITAAYPISLKPTNKRVILADGRSAWAMCAIDALGFHYAFNQPIRVESHCEHCADPIVLTLDKGKVQVEQGGDEIYVLHTDLDKYANWSCSCCNIMHFFNCQHSLSEWLAQHAHLEQETFAIDLETANKIAWLLFSH